MLPNSTKPSRIFPSLADWRGDRRLRLSLGLLLAWACGMPLLYALYTGHTWEDFFITFRCSRMLAEGHGLVFQPGERVHAFTSPLNTLLPALFHWLTGAETHFPALWLYRLASALIMGVGSLAMGFYLWQEARQPRLALLFYGLYTVLAAKIIVYAANGQEAGLMVGFLALLLTALLRGAETHWLAAGLAAAGLMWTRPDCPVHIGGAALAALLFLPQPKAAQWRGMLKGAAVCTGLYLPWLLWAWAYYGSPIPHTVIAKGGSMTGFSFPHLLIVLPKVFQGAFSPVQYGAGGWPGWVGVVASCAGFFAAAYWLLPVPDRCGRMLSFVFFLYSLYFGYVNLVAMLCPWYFPPATFCGAIVLARGLPRVADRFLAGQPRRQQLALALSLVFGLAFLQIFLISSVQLRAQQQFCENGVRREIGLWLKDRVKPEETVYLECLGYIGYFSGARMLDYPGLATPRVVAVRRQKKLDFQGIIPELWPDWLVLRPAELRDAAANPAVAARYGIVHGIDRSAEIEAYPPPRLFANRGRLPGLNYLLYDSCFIVLRKLPPTNPEPGQ